MGCNTTVVLYDLAAGINRQPSPNTYYPVSCNGCTFKLYYMSVSGQPYFYLIP